MRGRVGYLADRVPGRLHVERVSSTRQRRTQDETVLVVLGGQAARPEQSTINRRHHGGQPGTGIAELSGSCRHR